MPEREASAVHASARVRVEVLVSRSFRHLANASRDEAIEMAGLGPGDSVPDHLLA